MSNRLRHTGYPSHERLGHWVKALVGVGRSRQFCTTAGIELKAAGESIPGAGGWLVPTEFDNEIINVVETYGAFRRGANTRIIGRDSLDRPRRTGGATATWLTEGQTIPESSMTLDSTTTSMRKIGAMLRCSSEMFEDAASDVGRRFAQEVGLAFATAEDEAGFNGDGSDTYAGQVGLTARLTGTAGAVSGSAAHDTFAEIDSTDIGLVMAQVQASSLPFAAWHSAPRFMPASSVGLAFRRAGLSPCNGRMVRCKLAISVTP